MILLAFVAQLIPPLEAKFDRPHLSDTLRLKCDALLYRTAYVGNRCYFADLKEAIVSLNDAAKKCSSILPGSKVETKAVDAVFETMRIEKSKFHTEASAGGAKKTICYRHKCAEGKVSAVIPGKCIDRASISRTFSDSQQYCKEKGMDLPAIANDLENRMIQVKGNAWIRNPYLNGKWTTDKNYGLYSTCPQPQVVLRRQLDKPDNAPIALPDRQTTTRQPTTSVVYFRNRSPWHGHGRDDRRWPHGSHDERKRDGRGGRGCGRRKRAAGGQCPHAMATIIDASGYWQNRAQGTKELDFFNPPSQIICVTDTENDFVHRSQVSLTVPSNAAQVAPISLKGPCAAHHAPDSTEECRWTAPKDACAQLIDFYNRTWFTPMPNFPRETYTEIRLDIPHIPVADVSVKVIVRRGCMFFGYMHPKSGHPLQEAVSVSHRTYGEHQVPCQLTGELSDIYDGISRVNCFCDPTEATLNGHVPAPPPGKQCIEHHEYNDATKACEWKFESKFCGELITNDGRRQMLEIPNWPTNRRYDVEHWNTKRAENFHITVTEIIVRQDCWATLYWRGHHERFTLATSGYGKHKVASHYNGMLNSPDDGTHRVVCECIR